MSPNNFDHVSRGRGNPAVTGNGHGRVTEPQCDHFTGRNLGMIPYGFVAYTTPNRHDTDVRTILSSPPHDRGKNYSLS